MRPRFQWDLGRRSLELGERTLVMGVLNVTPDSFSDGGRYLGPDAAIAHGLALLDESADILDIGGESTRPGTPIDSPVARERTGAVSAQQELDRVLPVLEGIRRERPSAVLSIDTYKASVARAALDAGAEIVNDVSGLLWDAEMASTVAGRRCGLVLMHTRGLPREWRKLPPLDDPVGEFVKRELAVRVDAALGAGIGRDFIVLDPGFGFGKRGDENYSLLAHFETLRSLRYPLLVGLSRKSFLTQAGQPAANSASELAHRVRLHLWRELVHMFATSAALRTRSPFQRPHDISPELQRLDEVFSRSGSESLTLAATVAAALAGAHIVRVHAVAPAVEALAIADAIQQARG